MFTARAREAVLTAWSRPHSRVVIGRNPKVAGMVFTPDVRRIVAYGERGDIWVIGDNGTIEGKARASGLPGTVTRAAVNSDASRVALGTDQGTAAIIDTATGRHIDIETAEGSPMAVQWIGSAANSLILITARSGIATIYNPQTGKQITRLPGVVYDVLPLDDDHVVTSGGDRGDNRLRVWDIRTATKVAESSTMASVPRFLKRYKQYIVGLLLGNNPQIMAWDWKAGPNLVSNQFWYANDIQQVVVDERARTALYTSVIRIAGGKEVRTYTPVDGTLRGWLPQQEEVVNDVATSPDGQWITTAAVDGRVLVWFLGPLQQLPTYPTYELLARRGPVSQVGYLHDGKVVMSLGVDGTLRRWELPQVPRFDRHTGWVVDMDLNHDGSLLATAGTDHQVFIIDPHDLSRTPAATFSSEFPLMAVRFDPTEPHRVFTLARHDTPELWYWGGGKPERAQKYAKPPLGVSDYLVSLAVSPDGKTIASGDTQGTIHLWDVTTGALSTDRKFQGAGQPANSVAFDSTGQQLAATDSSGIRLWTLAAGDPPKLLAHPYATSVTFDPSGKHLASTAQDRTVRIWTPDGQRDRELIAHGDLVGHPSFSRDGGMLAVGTTDGFVEVWDIQSGVAIMLDRHHDHSVNSVVFTPGDRSHLISASDDMTVAQFSCTSCIDQDGVIREAVQWAKTN
jgi:WD40 repeat protein